MDKYHTAARKQLLAQGYRIIPSRGKVPAVVGWNDQDYVAQQLTSGAKGSAAERVERWEKRFPEAVSTGVRIEDGLGVVDADVDDLDLTTALWDLIETIAPEIANRAPLRYGGGQHKVAAFCQIEGERWVRIASKRYNGHCVEIFGGAPLRSGKCSRQFGVLGPHSFNADGSVARDYWWDASVALEGVGDLPRLTKAQAFAIAAGFERLAQERGWVADAAPAVESGGAVYDITAETRFDTSTGASQIGYAELCDEHSAHGDLRCSSSFMAGREGTDRNRCWVFHSPQHDCTAVWVYGDEQAHYPKELDPTAREEAIAPLLAEAMAAEGVVLPPDVPNWRERYAHGAPKATFHNAMLAMRAVGLTASLDVFHDRMVVGASRTDTPGGIAGPVTDASTMAIRVWLSDTFGLDFTERHLRDGVLALAGGNQCNPVTDMLAEAEANWDGLPRLDRLAVDLFNAADTPFNRQIVAKTLVAAVARARQPGIKFDTILTMESPEGWNKSSVWSVLAGEGNFSDERIIGKDSREVMEQLSGIWIHENAELAGMRKAEVETVKAYASRVSDRARPAYGHFVTEKPRHSIEVGTTNNDEYLQSQTGNRRFWPLRVERPIDIGRVKALRLQLWGEAAARQTAGESLVLDEDLWPAAAIAQEARRVRDAWEDELAEMSSVLSGVITQTGDEERVSSRDIFEYVLKVPAHLRDDRHAKRLANAMRVRGWVSGRWRTDKGLVRGYWRKVGGIVV